MSAPVYVASEWSPGDVVAVDGHPIVVFRAGCTTGHEGAIRWTNCHGVQHDIRHLSSTARRLVVIDPEDAEQVERLATLLWPHYAPNEHARLCKSEITADALREFANPTPRIEEPQGLGAVVEAKCACGTGQTRFVRDPAAYDFNKYPAGKRAGADVPWVARCGHHPWEKLTTVRVLSEGVTP